MRIVPEGSRAIVGGNMYFSSLKELRNLFGPHFNVIESKVIKKEQTGGTSVFNYFFMESIKDGE